MGDINGQTQDRLSKALEFLEDLRNEFEVRCTCFHRLKHLSEVSHSILVFGEWSFFTVIVKPVNSLANILEKGGTDSTLTVLNPEATVLKHLSDLVGVSLEVVASLLPVEELSVVEVELLLNFSALLSLIWSQGV